jgi:hypothetical protein
MPNRRLTFNRSAFPKTRDRAVRPMLEGLENRLLLYAALGDQWAFTSRITYSFMPDGTSIGGVPSALFQTLNANYPTATWENQIEQAASLWESAPNVNLALVSDGGEPEGCSGDQQDDPRFGDIRIGAVPLPSGVLAETFLPPPANGGTDAGDIMFNSSINWQINSNYDLMTVAAHEFGHALGLGESSLSTAVMYGTYNGIKQALASDDIAGIQSIYGAPQYDQFNSGGQRNSSFSTAANINSYIQSNAQIAIPSLDITASGQSEWFYVNVPSTTTGTMTVTVQSSNLSSLAPKLQVWTSGLSLVGQASAANTFGATVSVSATVQAGQGYYFKVMAAGGPAPVGGYGLLANFGNQSQSPIPPPNTVVAAQPDQGGVTENDNAPVGGGGGGGGGLIGGWALVDAIIADIGSLNGWAEGLTLSATQNGGDGMSGWNQTGDSTSGWSAQAAWNYATSTTSIAATSTTQAITFGSVLPGSSTQSASAPSITAVVAIGPTPGVLQAVDDVLEQLASDAQQDNGALSFGD